MSEAPQPHLLIWDGDCTFCGNVVTWVRRHDRSGRFLAVPYQNCPSPPMTPELRDAAQAAVQVLRSDGSRLSGGAAALYVLVEIDRYAWIARLAMRWPLAAIVERGYRVVARHRTFFGRFLFRGR